jgi:hypothetical protein
MSKIISVFKGFLFASLLITVAAVTNSQAQSVLGSVDPDWKGPRANCPGGFYLDNMPYWEYLIELQYGTSNGDGLVCIREIKERGEVVGYRVYDNTF